MTLPALPATSPVPATTFIDNPERQLGRGWSVGLLRRLLTRMICGRLLIITPAGDRIDWTAPAPGPEAVLVLKRWRTLRRLLIEGDLGFAEAYIAGDWETPHLVDLLTLGIANERALGSSLRPTILAKLLHRVDHVLNANTRRGSRRNISAHYDLGNEFYAAWLDRGMTYSSALYSAEDQSLEDAQTAKQDRVIEMLDAAPDAAVLEIGCGWGGLAERLAESGRHVTGLTLSHEQLAYAQTRLQTAKLDARADLRLQDYRDVAGPFDAVVSIEMLEAVGIAYWPTYFAKLRDLLRPGGTAVLQVITVSEERYLTYRDTADFIQRHIFPGGMLPSPSILRQQIEMAGLVLQEEQTFASSYARTLSVWAKQFQDAWPRLQNRKGFDERFHRKWAYYLAYCEAGFRNDALDVGLYRIGRPEAEG